MFSKSKDSAIRLLNFSQSDGNKELLSPTTLSFPKGRIGVFVGKQDVNKAHFMRAIAGFEEAQSGDVVIGNRSLRNSGADYKRNVFLVSSSIQFNLPSNIDEAEVKIFDNLGKLLKTYKVDNTFNDLIVDNSDFANGIYHCTIEIGGSIIESKEIVISK